RWLSRNNDTFPLMPPPRTPLHSCELVSIRGFLLHTDGFGHYRGSGNRVRDQFHILRERNIFLRVRKGQERSGKVRMRGKLQSWFLQISPATNSQLSKKWTPSLRRKYGPEPGLTLKPTGYEASASRNRMTSPEQAKG